MAVSCTAACSYVSELLCSSVEKNLDAYFDAFAALSAAKFLCASALACLDRYNSGCVNSFLLFMKHIFVFFKVLRVLCCLLWFTIPIILRNYLKHLSI